VTISTSSTRKPASTEAGFFAFDGKRQ